MKRTTLAGSLACLVLGTPVGAVAAETPPADGQQVFAAHGYTNCHGTAGDHPTSKYVPVLRGKSADHIFENATAIFGGAVMIIALAGSLAPLFPESMLLGLFQYICIPACALWFVLVGLQLYRYGSRIQTTQPMEAAA